MAVTLEDLNNMNEKYSNTSCEPDKWDDIYCAGKLFNTTKNSGSRLIMSSAFMEQTIIPVNPEFPLIYTGYENAFGRYADSITKSEKNYRIIKRISKFPNKPTHIYYYIVQDIITGVYNIIEMKHYESYAETHGIVKPQTDGDLFLEGTIIPEGKILAHAPSRDEYGNYCLGVNANTAYVSWTNNEEDGYLLSDEFAAKTKYTQIEETTDTVNKNIILLDLYGDSDEYKAFPDIGENVKNGIICANRQINYQFAASETTRSSLKKIIDSDTVFHGRGTIVDIDVFINDEEELKNNTCRNQLLKYWAISKIFHQTIVDELGKIVNNKNNRFTFELQSLYERSRDFLNPNIQFSSNNGVFEFGFISFTTAYSAHLVEGSKITDRAASKGVTCHIIPKAMMPRDKWGNVADIVQSPPSIVGRANSDQTYECEKNYISFFVRKLMAEASKYGVEKQFAILYDYIEYIDKPQAVAMRAAFDASPTIGKEEFIADNIINGIHIRQGPTNNMTYEQICYLYDKYKIKPDRVRVQREIHKHGFNKKLLIDKNDQFFTILKNTKGEIINTLMTPNDVSETKDKSKELFGDDEYIYTDEYALPNGKDCENGIRLAKINDENKITNIKYSGSKTFDEMIDSTWTDETYVVSETKDTVTLSFLTEKPVIIAPKFFVILEHVPEGKLSARFIGSTNPLGLPNKSGKSENADKGTYGSSPIKYGEMEVNNALIRIKPNIVYRYLSEVATNPELRNKLCYNLLYKDPLSMHNIDVPITDKCDNIPAKEFNAYLFCLGIEVLNDPNEDIYSQFDDKDYTDDELDAIFEEQIKQYPADKILA